MRRSTDKYFRKFFKKDGRPTRRGVRRLFNYCEKRTLMELLKIGK